MKLANQELEVAHQIGAFNGPNLVNSLQSGLLTTARFRWSSEAVKRCGSSVRLVVVSDEQHHSRTIGVSAWRKLGWSRNQQMWLTIQLRITKIYQVMSLEIRSRESLLWCFSWPLGQKWPGYSW